MSINPVENELAALFARRNTTQCKGNSPVERATFAETLRAAVEGGGQQGTGGIPADSAAEMLRLKMIKNAISLSDDPTGRSQSDYKNPVQLLLSAFTFIEPPVAKALIVDEPPSTKVAVAGDSVVTKVTNVSPYKENSGAVSGSFLETIILKAARRYGVDQALIRAVIKVESNFNVRAVSRAGAQGLMQLMPATSKSLGVTEPFDPEQNVMAGTRFLSDMLDRYKGDLNSALAAYNWGPGNVDKGKALPRETREYLVKIKSYYSQAV